MIPSGQSFWSTGFQLLLIHLIVNKPAFIQLVLQGL